ncbi:hypothetical protein CDD83_6113 [Cordyceps sp. RAO-2017]|nr:hypothetical protein CDD83_6113 [Cordyceps sp. RAO-2017]
MEADTAHRYRSRILREMNANRANPFNSPPSSTGSHGTLSPTMSSVFSDPDGESTRRLHEDIARVTAPRKLPVNWEAAHRKWPDFFSMPPASRDAPHDLDDADDTDKLTVDSRAFNSKQNKPPVASVKFVDDSTQDAWQGSNKTRAEMQPRVDNESDLSSILSKSPARSLVHRASAKSTRNPSPLSKVSHARKPSASAANQHQRHASITEALDRLRRASLSPPKDDEQRQRARDSESPPLSSAKSSLTAVPPSPNSLADPEGHSTSHVRSFFMPDVSHLGDFVTGTLKFSGSMKNGVPIFVKHGKVYDRRETSAGAHAEVDGIAVPQDEEKIFVSMDMIRDEIVSLQDHHEKVQEYAETLQQQVEKLEAQLKSRKFSNGDRGRNHHDESLSIRNTELVREVTSLQARLDAAQQKINNSEMENVSLAHERDRAVSRLQGACDDISKLTRKLSVREKELESSHKQLETTDHMRQENDTLRRDLISLKQGRDALELEITSLRAENDALRKEQKRLKDEVESLRSDNNSLRRGDDSLLSENRSLRSNNRALMEENEDLRENYDGAHHALEAAHERLEALKQQVDAVDQEKTTLREDNESLVRHNDKYFSENKLLRRENSGFERSLHELREDNLRLREEVDFLKQQLDHCRPLPKDDLSARLDETEENMTSAFFVPDITINTNESGPAEATETGEVPAVPELTSHSRKTMTSVRNETQKEVRDISRREVQQTSKSKATKNASNKHTSQQGQKVAFSIPEKPAQNDRHAANKGSKRRNASRAASGHVMNVFHDLDDTTELQSVENTIQDQALVSLNLSANNDATGRSRHRDTTEQSRKSQQTKDVTRTSQKLVVETDLATESSRRAVDQGSCPALSSDARRILDGLCEHNCRNCIVCSRITSHRGVISAAEAATGKKRVAVPRPVPVTDRGIADDNATMRPCQSPGHALALVIKGLEDEARHLELELSRLQARYNASDKALGRKERLGLMEGIRTLLKRLEVKNDQIYSLYDVVEGQKAAGQAMTEEEVEMTVLNITGMTVRDVTSGSEQFTWEGIRDAA